MISLTLQMSSDKSPFCRNSPLTCSVIAPLVRRPVCEIGWIGPIGADCSKALPMHQGAPASSCRSAGRGASCPGRWHSPRCAALHRRPRCGARRGRWPPPVRSHGAGCSSGWDRPSCPSGLRPPAAPHRLASGRRTAARGRCAHLDGMFDIVAPDAVDAVHRKRAAIGHGHDGLGRRSQHEAHGRSFAAEFAKPTQGRSDDATRAGRINCHACSICAASSIAVSAGAPAQYRVPADDNRDRAICTACGEVHYENPLNVVGTVPVGASRCCCAGATSSRAWAVDVAGRLHGTG